ncbi:MAG: hypothetical protein EP332_03865 [Bacteroidetes bacterium]|nr:MAG: hypothetical protein EP332_03865 [Bacteroidota bacterium]
MLSKNWLTENIIDFEYKKYVLLAYLQQVQHDFKQPVLYPHMAELIEHYRKLLDFNKATEVVKEMNKGELSGIDLERFQLLYEQTLQNDKVMLELESIVDFALPQFKYHLSQGKEIYEDIEQQLSLVPIGIVPLYKQEGYLLLKSNEVSETRVYEYRITLFQNAHEKFRGIHTHYIDTFRNSLINTFEGMKKNLIQQRKKLPNPATYLIESEKQYPVDGTLLPIASRMLVRYLSTSF